MSTTGRTGRPISWLYKVRAEGAGGALTVPRPIFEQIPEGTLFKLKVIDTGLMYEITDQEDATNIPWVEKKSPSRPSTRKKGS